jgi:hypothetical protein
MRGRCLRPTSDRYSAYGGRGIRICPRWENDFFAFLDDVGRAPSAKHSIDRIDNDGNYEPGNVRWALDSEQRRNCRGNHYVSVGGETMALVDACAMNNLPISTVCNRLRRGFSLESALGIQGAIDVRASVIRPTGRPKGLGLRPALERIFRIVLAAYPSAISRHELYLRLADPKPLSIKSDVNCLIALGYAERLPNNRVRAKSNIAYIAVIDIAIPVDMADAASVAAAIKAADSIEASLPAESKVEFTSRGFGKMAAA